MKTQDILILGGVGLGAYFLLGRGAGSSTSQCGAGNPVYTITAGQYPNVPAGTYCDADLPALGFVMVSGRWYHNSQVSPPTNLPPNIPPAPTTNTTAPNYIQWMQSLANLGINLYTTIAGAVQKMKTTSVDWNNSKANVDIAYSTNVIRQEVNPTTSINRSAPDGTRLTMSTNGQQTTINFINASGQTIKTGVIDWYNERLQGFDTGSISGIGNSLGQVFLTVTPKKIGSIYDYKHPAQLTHCADGTYSDATKGACSYHGGAHEIEFHKPSGRRAYNYNKRKRTEPVHYMSYRKAYKSSWAKQNRKSDRTLTI
jgi:hypothetical protein